MSREDFEDLQARMKKRQEKVVSTITSAVVEKKSRSKHGNEKVKIEGRTFDSKVEGRRYRQLRILEDAGVISNLRCQVAFELAPAVHLRGRHRMSPPLRYFADFVYDDQDGKQVVEDVKGQEKVTEGFRIKRHLMATVHGINIVEIRQGRK